MSEKKQLDVGQIKKCPKCAEDIQQEAKKCKHCGSDVSSKKEINTKTGCLVLVIVVFFIIIIATLSSDDSGSNNSAPAQSPTLSIGEEGIINNNDNASLCDGMTVVGVTKEDLDASIDASVANDVEGHAELILTGRIFLVKNCLPIRKIDSAGTLGSVAKVRFIGNTTDIFSTTGWIPYEFAKKNN